MEKIKLCELRDRIAKNCTEEFKRKLSDFIDKIEYLVLDIAYALDEIKNTSNLAKLPDVIDLADNLADTPH